MVAYIPPILQLQVMLVADANFCLLPFHLSLQLTGNIWPESLFTSNFPADKIFFFLETYLPNSLVMLYICSLGASF